VAGSRDRRRAASTILLWAIENSQLRAESGLRSWS
jgi:hypothetical protein